MCVCVYVHVLGGEVSRPQPELTPVSSIPDFGHGGQADAILTPVLLVLHACDTVVGDRAGQLLGLGVGGRRASY